MNMHEEVEEGEEEPLNGRSLSSSRKEKKSRLGYVRLVHKKAHAFTYFHAKQATE